MFISNRKLRGSLFATAAIMALGAPAALAAEDPMTGVGVDETAVGTEDNPDADVRTKTPMNDAHMGDHMGADKEHDPSMSSAETDEESPNRESEKTQSASVEGDKFVSASALNVRDEASMDGEVVDVLQNGEKVTVHDTSGEWARISADNETEKFVYQSYLSDTAPMGSGGPEYASEPEGFDGMSEDERNDDILNKDSAEPDASNSDEAPATGYDTP